MILALVLDDPCTSGINGDIRELIFQNEPTKFIRHPAGA
jgi:hypothetical protein